MSPSYRLPNLFAKNDALTADQILRKKKTLLCCCILTCSLMLEPDLFSILVHFPPYLALLFLVFICTFLA